MLDNLDKAERDWRSRNLFRPQRRNLTWLRRLLVVLAAIGLMIWQDETLALLAELLE